MSKTPANLNFFCFVIMLVLSEIFNSNGGDKHFFSFRMLVNILSKAILSDRYRL